MSIFATAVPAGAARTKHAPAIALFYGGVLVIMAVSQLFSFEKFIPLVETFKLPGGHGTATLVAALMVTFEVFALPFLLRMQLSPLMRLVSMAIGLIVPILWLIVSGWLNITGVAVKNTGILGASVPLPVGWWAVFFSAALIVLSIWSMWGLWPNTKHRKK